MWDYGKQIKYLAPEEKELERQRKKHLTTCRKNRKKRKRKK